MISGGKEKEFQGMEDQRIMATKKVQSKKLLLKY